MSKKKITSLSDEKWEELCTYRLQCYDQAINDEPTPKKELSETYKYLVKAFTNQDISKVHWSAGPRNAYKYMKKRGENISRQYQKCFYAWGTYWALHYNFLCTIDGITSDPELFEKLQAFVTTSKGCLFWVFSDEIVAVERPKGVYLNNSGRLHNVNGPAMHWSDGTAFYFVDGVAVKGEYVKNPRSLKITTIKKTSNAEERRALMLLYGLERYLKDTNAKMIDATINQQLWESGGEKFLICCDGSTNRKYELTVPSHVTTCDEAQTQLAGIPVEHIIAGS